MQTSITSVWRRMIVIPFRVSIPADQQDPYLASKLKAELPGIFNWAAEGLRTLRREGRFIIPPVCQQAWEEFKRESNPAREFLTERYEIGSTIDAVACTSIYDDYRQWCVERGFKALDVTNFGKELRKVFRAVERCRESTGQRSWNYHGLRRAVAVDPSVTTSETTLTKTIAG